MYFTKELNSFQKAILQDYIYNQNINIIINNNISNTLLTSDFEINENQLKTNLYQYNNLNNWLFVIKNGTLKEIRSLN